MVGKKPSFPRPNKVTHSLTNVYGLEARVGGKRLLPAEGGGHALVSKVTVPSAATAATATRAVHGGGKAAAVDPPVAVLTDEL